MAFIKNLFFKSEEYKHGICIDSCDCQFDQETDNSVDYKVKTGCLVKLFEYNTNNVVLSLFTDKLKLTTSNSSHFKLIDEKLFKYLNAINDLEERIKFYMNDDRREFVINLENSAIVNVGDLEPRALGLFRDIKEDNMKIFITVELMMEPTEDLMKSIRENSNRISSTNLKHSLSANMISKMDTEYFYKAKAKNVNIEKPYQINGSSNYGNIPRKSKFSNLTEQTRKSEQTDDINQNIENYILPVKTTFECHLKEDKQCLQCMNVNDNESYDLVYGTEAKELNSENDSFGERSTSCDEDIIIQTTNKQVKQTTTTAVDEAFSFFMGQSSSERPLSVSSEKRKSSESSKYSDTDSDSSDTITQTGSSSLSLDTQKHKEVQAGNTILINRLFTAVGHKIQEAHSSISNSKQEMPPEKLFTSWNCKMCLNINEYSNNICIKCNYDKNVEILEQVNSQTDVNQTLTVTQLNSIEIEKNHESNNAVTDETKNSANTTDITVIRNNTATQCTICNKPLLETEGFILHLCQHTVCETCIKSQFESEILNCPVVINNKPCGQSFELSEIKYFFTNQQFERIQQCYNKNCRGYHLCEKDNKPTEFNCNVCKLNNCLECKVMHDGLTCQAFSMLTNGKKSLELDDVLNFIRNVAAKPCSNCNSSNKDDKTDQACCEVQPLSPIAPKSLTVQPPMMPPPPPPPMPPPPPPPTSNPINKISSSSNNKIKVQKNPNDDLMAELHNKLKARRNAIRL